MLKTLLIAALLLFTIACNDSKTEPATEATAETPATETPAPAAPHEYAVKATYSSSFEIGDPKNGDAIIELWKQFDDNTLDMGMDKFADTVTIWMNDGWKYYGTRDSLMKMMKTLRGEYSEVKSVVVALVPLKSTDMNQSWVSIYGTEYTTMKNKKDSLDIQENWRFNKDGKIDFMHSYRRKK